MLDITRVGVLHCGLMGSGIAQAAATAGFGTVVRDVGEAFLAKGRAGIYRSLGKLVEKGKLDGGTREAALASNTSSLTIGEMASATGRPDRFVGLHFFNPVPLMPLVEVVRAVTTSAETFEAALEFVRRLGKEPVAARDRSGFIVNLLLVPYLLDAVRALERSAGSIADIDRAMQLGCGHPMGPFTLLDFVGLDTTVRIAEIMFEEYREPRYAPPPLLRRMVTAGLHGRKTGRGFYDYATDPPLPSDPGL